jgi:hypothetical protein
MGSGCAATPISVPQPVIAYHPESDTTGAQILLLERVPDGVIPKPKLDSKKPVECCLCDEKIVLNKMCNHVGAHILHSLCGTNDPKPAQSRLLERILVDFVAYGLSVWHG